MHKLRRLHLDTIGVRENRFASLTIDAVDLAGDPVDTLVWMRNGSGKTTILSLLAAHILPGRRDFLAARKRKRRDDAARTLEDLVQGSDTAHVAAEWQAPDGSLLATGAVWEWANKRRPLDYNGAGAAKLKHLFWALRPEPAVEGASFEELPFTSRTRGQVDLEGFERHVKSLATEGVDAVTTREIQAWHHRVLHDRGFDADLYRYFVTVNATEGGLDALFANIRTDNDFARFLMGFVADAERAESVRNLLRDVAGELALLPTYRVEREFCVDAQPRLAELAGAHDKVLVAEQERKTAAAAAAGFRHGLLLAADAAGREAALAETAISATDAERQRKRQAADTARRRRDELLRIAARRWRDNAKQEVRAGEAALTAAQLEHGAWEAVEDLLRLRRRTTEVNAHRDAIAAARAEAAPLLAQEDQAAADLVAAYDAELASASARERRLGETVEGEKDRSKAAREEANAALSERATLEKEAEGLHQRIAELQAKHDRAVESGLLTADADPDRAVEQEEATLSVLRGDLDGAAQDAETAAARERTTTQALERARGDLDDNLQVARDARSVLQSLKRQAAPLDTSELTAQLAQADDIDTLTDAARLAGMANERVADANTKLLEVALDASADELAVTALEATRLLPLRPAVREVLTALDGADVHATAGWAYLAKHVPADAAPIVVAALPEVCDGVIVYGDLDDAAGAVTGLALDDPVVLAPAAVLADPLGADARTWVVAGPAAARYDTAAGAAELTRRQARVSQHDQAGAALRTERDAWSELAASLRALAASVQEHGGIAAVRSAVEIAEAATQAARNALAEAEAAHHSAKERLTATQNRKTELEREITQVESRLARLQELAADLRNLPRDRARLREIPQLLNATADRKQAADRQENAANARVKSIEQELAVLSTEMKRWRADRDGVPVSGTRTGRVHADGLDAAKHRYEQARRLTINKFDEAELTRRLDDLEREVRKASDEWSRHGEDARARAEELAATAGAAESSLRDHARSQAQQALMAANTRATLARTDLEAAEKAVTDRSPTGRGRLRHADLTEEPATRAEAEDAARVEEATAASAQEQVTVLEQRIESLKVDRDSAAGRATTFGFLVDNLDDWEHLPASAPAVIPMDPDTAKEQADRTRQGARAAAKRYTAAQSERSHSFDQLRTWSADDRFARSSEDSQAMARLRALFREQPVTVVAERAAGLAAELDQRRNRIDEQLAHIEQSQDNVATRLVDLVRSALADLSRFSSLSVLPESIGPWGGHTFVDVRPRGDRPGADQIRVRVGELVDRLVEPGTSLDIDPLELLWKATEAAVAPGGFRARILKPDPAQPTGKVGVTDMNKWSGGENLTACLLLFCVMVKLRAENRGGRRGAGMAGGLVPLDNPLGKANYVPFLHLQRTVAATAGVQLLFFTGIGDLPAVRVFDSVVACAKRGVKGGAGAYVTIDGANTAQAAPSPDEATGLDQEVSGARLVRQH